MALTHQALDVVLGRLSLCSIARLCTTGASCNSLCTQLLVRQPVTVLAMLLDQVRKAATLQAQLTKANCSKHLHSIARKQQKCVSAVQWLLQAKASGSQVVPSRLVADHPAFVQQLMYTPNLPQAMTDVLVKEAGICISQQQLMAGVALSVEGIESWVCALRASGHPSDLPAWSEAVCCGDTAYLDALTLRSPVNDMLGLLQLAINCRSSIALQLFRKQTLERWRQQVPAHLLQNLVLTTIRRGHDAAILHELLSIQPITTSTTASAVRIELQRASTGNCVFSSRGDIRRLQYMPCLLQQAAAHQLEAGLVAEVAHATARLTDWPILMLDYLCGLPAMQLLPGVALSRLLGTVVHRCKSSRCDLLLELEVLHALCRLECARQLQQQVVADLLVDAQDGAHAAVAAVLCHYLDPQQHLHSQDSIQHSFLH